MTNSIAVESSPCGLSQCNSRGFDPFIIIGPIIIIVLLLIGGGTGKRVRLNPKQRAYKRYQWHRRNKRLMIETVTGKYIDENDPEGNLMCAIKYAQINNVPVDRMIEIFAEENIRIIHDL
jgi:hypothetical protein